MKRRNEKGLTLIELIVAFTVLLILTSMAVPLARARVRVERERDLRAALREMYSAIDKYKDYCDASYFGPVKAGTNCWPETLEPARNPLPHGWRAGVTTRNRVCHQAPSHTSCCTR